MYKRKNTYRQYGRVLRKFTETRMTAAQKGTNYEMTEKKDSDRHSDWSRQKS